MTQVLKCISTGILSHFFCKGAFFEVGGYLDIDGLVFLVVVGSHSGLPVVGSCFHDELEFILSAEHEAGIVVHGHSKAWQVLLL